MEGKPNLFDQVRKGDKTAFEMLFREYYGHLCAYANTFVKNLDAAQDLVQEFLFHIWEIKTELPLDVPVKAYLFKSVHNRCLNILKHEQVKGKYQEQSLLDYKDSFYEENGSDQDELHEKIRESIDKLPPERKKVFIMHRYDELKYKEIAEKLNISIKTVENQIGKALSFLREELKDYLPLILLLLFGATVRNIPFIPYGMFSIIFIVF
jgi:RNA polymerase sigma-70 factor, ECF subfamily